MALSVNQSVEYAVKYAGKSSVKSAAAKRASRHGLAEVAAAADQPPQATTTTSPRFECPRCRRPHGDKRGRGDLCARCVIRKEQERASNHSHRSPKGKRLRRCECEIALRDDLDDKPARWRDDRKHKDGKGAAAAAAGQRPNQQRKARRRARAGPPTVRDDPVDDGVVLACDRDALLPSDRPRELIFPAVLYFPTGERFIDIEAALTMDDIRHEEDHPQFVVRTGPAKSRQRGKKMRGAVIGHDKGGGGGSGGSALAADDEDDGYELVEGEEDDFEAAVVAVEEWEDLE